MKKRLPEEKVTFPHEVTQHGTTVKIYRGDNNGYPSFFLHWHGEGGGRQRKRCTTFAKALDEAGVVLNAIINRKREILELTNEDRDQYLKARAVLAETGVDLHSATTQFAEARGIIGGIASLAEAARFYINRHGKVKKQTTAVIVEEFMKENSRKSAKYIKDMRMRLDRFAEHFPGLIGEITKQEIEAWLVGLNLGDRSRLNYRRATITLFKYSQKWGYLPEGKTEAEKVEKVTVDDGGDIGIFTPDELTRLLAVADNEVMPYLALGAFAGIRTAEIVRLDWSEVNFDTGNIEIKKRKAKTKSRRLIKMQPNLVAWLKTVAQASGPVVPRARPDYTAAEVLANRCRPKVAWQRNGLRHSYCSYRLAITQNDHQVSNEMGNSPGMLYTNYRELVTKEAADEWFAILPEKTDPQK